MAVIIQLKMLLSRNLQVCDDDDEDVGYGLCNGTPVFFFQYTTSLILHFKLHYIQITLRYIKNICQERVKP